MASFALGGLTGNIIFPFIIIVSQADFESNVRTAKRETEWASYYNSQQYNHFHLTYLQISDLQKIFGKLIL